MEFDNTGYWCFLLYLFGDDARAAHTFRTNVAGHPMLLPEINECGRPVTSVDVEDREQHILIFLLKYWAEKVTDKLILNPLFSCPISPMFDKDIVRVNCRQCLNDEGECPIHSLIGFLNPYQKRWKKKSAGYMKT